MLDLPIGTADFESIRKNGDYYADKTEFLYQLVRRERPYFLSRPRRFGKTLLVNTLENILRGRRELFKGLWIDGADYDWTPYPIIRLDMNGVVGVDVATTQHKLSRKLIALAKREGEEYKEDDPSVLLEALIELLNGKYNQKVAILIDEYDAPILKYIENPDKADKFREALSDFYGVLKTNVTMIGHIFITGVSRFTKASLFSKLNNLDDITLDSNFATICGFTETDLEYLLGEYQDHLLDTFIKNGVMLPGSTPEYLKQLIHDWYDGYSWDGKTRVFNPWSLLHFFNKAKIFEYWYDSGTPTFLKELVDNGNVDFDLTKEIRDFNELKNNVDKISLIDPAVLMFQTGYLTINESLPTLDGPYNYSLRMPNLEVKGSFVPLMLSLQAPNDKMRTSKLAARTRDCLMTLDADGFEENFGGFLAQWNYDAHIEEEKYYQTLLEAALLMAGQRFWPQEHTAHGRLDIHIEGPKHEEYIIEIKLFREEKDSDGSSRTPPLKTDEITQLKEKMATLADDALMQISEKYAQKFLGDSRVVKIAVVVARRTFPFMQFQVVEKK